MIDCISEYIMIDGIFVQFAKVQLQTEVGTITVYEVVRIIDGVALFIEDHIYRLLNSAQILGVKLPDSEEAITKKMLQFIAHEQILTGNIKLIFKFSKNVSTCLLYQLRHNYPTQQMYDEGVKTATMLVERSNPNAKSVQPFKQITEKCITEKNIFEAILIDKDGNITEGSKSNVFFVKDNEIITAPAQDVLLGITRKYVIESAKTLRLPIIERKITQNELTNFDAAFISGTSPKILPIKKINSVTYNPQNGIVTQLKLEYDRIILHYINARK